MGGVKNANLKRMINRAHPSYKIQKYRQQLSKIL